MMVVATTECSWLYDKSFESLYVYIGGSDLDNNFVDMYITSNTVKLWFVPSNLAGVQLANSGQGRRGHCTWGMSRLLYCHE